MSWNPFKKEPKEQTPPRAADALVTGAAGSVPPEVQDATDPLLELGSELLAETAELVRESGPVRLERVRLAGASAPFLRLRVQEPGGLSRAIAQLLLELPDAATGFADMLVDGEAALAAKLADAPRTLAQAARLQQVLDALAQTARLLAQAQQLVGLAWLTPRADGVLLNFAADDPQCLRDCTAQFAGWDGLGPVAADAPARLARLGADVCRARAEAAGWDTGPAGVRNLRPGFHAAQAEALARLFETLSQQPGLDYATLAQACATLRPVLARACATDPGRKRPHNEDACLMLELEQASSGGAWLTLAAVADGMGGHASGEVASHLALSLLRLHILSNLLAPRQGPPDAAGLPSYLAGVIPAIDRALIERANLDEALAGMGTTLCGYSALAAQSTLNQQAGPRTGVIFNVGDSRCYLLAAEGALRLSHDHSYVQGLVDSGAITLAEAFTHPQKNIITRCLGGSATSGSEPDILSFSAGPGDVLLLCSDGLSDMLDDAAISAVVCETGLDDLPALAAELTRRANEAGGNDNITAVLLRWELAG
jgi:PPM family protein phosphatase